MKNQVTRTILLLGISIALFAVVLLVPASKNLLWFQIIRGASGGFGLAGCVSFVMLLIDQLNAGRR